MDNKQIARVGDTTHGTCYRHTKPITVDGTITTGANGFTGDGKALARVGDTVTASCGHTGIINSGASKATCNGRPIARVGDTFTGDYVGNITSGYGKGTVI